MTDQNDNPPAEATVRRTATTTPASGETGCWRAAAHDLRSAVGVVLTYCEFLRDESASPLTPAQRESAGIIHATGEGMLRLLNQLSCYTKLAAGEVPFDRQPVDLAALVGQAVNLNAPAAKRKKIQLTYAAPKGWPALTVDGERILGVVQELIQNAVQASPAGSDVQISLQRSAQQIVCSVSDQGPGIAVENQARLFQPFGRVSTTPSGSSVGSGLGLAIARETIERHGGRIWLKSQLDQGAAFHVSLPIPAPLDPVPREPFALPAIPSL